MALGKNLTKKTGVSKSVKAQDDAPKPQEKEVASPEPVEIEEEHIALEQFCVFNAGQEEYALPINMIKEIVKLPAIATVPQMPDYLVGMVNVRGSIYGILNLSIFFKGNESGDSSDYKFLLVLDHEEYKMGILISEVPDTVSVSANSIEKLNSSAIKSIKGRKYLQGIIRKDKRMIILFDILEMISSPQFTEVMV